MANYASLASRKSEILLISNHIWILIAVIFLNIKGAALLSIEREWFRVQQNLLFMLLCIENCNASFVLLGSFLLRVQLSMCRTMHHMTALQNCGWTAVALDKPGFFDMAVCCNYPMKRLPSVCVCVCDTEYFTTITTSSVGRYCIPKK